MRNENLRAVCRDLGFDRVSTVIASGNIVFDAHSGDPAELEAELEAAWPERLGFESRTILRSRDELGRMLAAAPFGELVHGKEQYLLATFTQVPIPPGWSPARRPTDVPFEVVGVTEREIFTVADVTARRAPDVMGWLEHELGKGITSRTWLTVQRIVRKMDSDR